MSDGEFGLCGRCVYQRIIPTPRGGRFSQCGRHFTEPRFVKYPRIPVNRCDGFEDRPPNSEAKTEAKGKPKS